MGKSTSGHKTIITLSGINIAVAVLSFIFLIVYIATIVSAVDEEQVEDAKIGIAIASLALFVLLLVLFAILDVVIGIVALIHKDKFSNESSWLIVICMIGVGFFFSGYIGICALIGVIIVTKQDADKVKKGEDTKSSSTKEDKSSNVISATVIQGPPPGNGYASAAPATYEATQVQYQQYPTAQQYGAQPYEAQPYGAQPAQPYSAPPPQAGSATYTYQY